MAPHDVAQEPASRQTLLASSSSGSLAELFAEAAAIMARLRGPGGCPWDQEQTPDSIRHYTLEETYEVLDAIERRNPADLCEELGDLLLQVLFYAQMASEAGEFTLADVVGGLNRKLVRRHPHVFGPEASAAAGNAAVLESAEPGIDTDRVLSNWNAIKKIEKQAKPQHEVVPLGRMAGVLRGQPALLEAQKLGSTAARCGFDWPSASGLIAKIREEIEEVEAEIAAGHGPTREMQLEVGDLLFVITNLARHLKVDAETALRDASGKFRIRFAHMEQCERQELEAGGPALEDRSLEELEALWQRAKVAERQAKAADAPETAAGTVAKDQPGDSGTRESQ